MNWVEKYMRIPYEAKGASFRGANCWGLVHLVLKEEAGIITPSYGEISARHLLSITRTVGNSRGIPPWQHKVEPGEEEMFDVVIFKGIMRGHAVDMHTGIVTQRGMILHTEEGSGVAHVPFRDSEKGKVNFALANRIVAIFRHEALYEAN